MICSPVYTCLYAQRFACGNADWFPHSVIPDISPQVYHELVVLEQLHKHPEFCPGASLEAITRPPLLLY